MTEAAVAAAVVLAAGEGTRMRSATPKVLHALCGRSMVGHVVAACEELQAGQVAVVVGHAREQVTAHLTEVGEQLGTDNIVTAVQHEQHGTGHAVAVALDELPGLAGTVVVLPGDSPLITGETLRRLVTAHHRAGAAGTMLTAVLAEPHGYGRVVRDDTGAVVRIVEQKDATVEEEAISEVATGMYAFEADLLRAALGRLTTDNAQGEQYLPDVVGIFVGDGRHVAAVVAEDAAETEGCNDRAQLAVARRRMSDRLALHWMRAGVSIVDPATTWLDATVTLEPDVTLLPGTILEGATHVATGATVGPDTSLKDTVVGEGATVVRSHCLLADIGPEATVGPFTYLRPGASLGRGAKTGAYVEVKASSIGDGSKVPHLSYVGDTSIGERSNLGAATVTVNYDGVAKHRTVIGDDVRIGSDTMLVAPVTVGDGAYTAAGSVVTEDVPPGSLAIERAQQRNVEGWVLRRRAGSSAADAAARASQADSDEGEAQ